MRLLIWHVDSFRSTLSEKGRSSLIEEPPEKETYVEEALIVLTAVEKSDEDDPETIASKAAKSIKKHAKNVGAKNIVVHPFTHLFTDLAAPEIAVPLMDDVNRLLNERGLNSIRTPFGWFNTLDIKAKGHPLSRVAKTIKAE
ncbi:threonyl-tRNA synthetase editing domain-containing protein [bacterium]